MGFRHHRKERKILFFLKGKNFKALFRRGKFLQITVISKEKIAASFSVDSLHRNLFI